MVDALIASFMVALSALGLCSLFTVMRKSETIGQGETVATQMSQRLIEQLQLLKPSDITPSALTTLNLIDTGQSQQPLSFSNIPLDAGTGHSPSKALRNGTGTMTYETISGDSVRVVITIGWTSESGKQRSLTTGTVLGGYR